MHALTFRDELDDATAREFDLLIGRLGSFFLAEHLEDGTHRDIPPVGTIVLWPAVTPPARWLICNGQSVHQDTYPALFKVLGVTFGAGSGTTFTLPNLTPPTNTVYIVFAGAPVT